MGFLWVMDFGQRHWWIQEKTEQSDKLPLAPKLVGAHGWAGVWRTVGHAHLGAGTKVRGALQVWRDLTVLESEILTNGQGEIGQNRRNLGLTPTPGPHAIAKDREDRP